MMQIAFSLQAFLFNSINERQFPTTKSRWEVKNETVGSGFTGDDNADLLY
ncbi:TPA: hypothetical protein ACJINU_002184 [Escherichia coli]